MKSNIKSSKFLIFFISLLFVVESIFAFDSIAVFGDSYSDIGEVYRISEGVFPPSPPYFEGRFSDGPVWVEYLTTKLNLISINYAAGGSTTNSLFIPGGSGFNDEIIVPGMRQQVNDYVSFIYANGGIDSKTNNVLYLTSVFGDDYVYSIKHGLEVPSPEQVIGQLITNMQTLYIEFGAKNFVVATLPNLANFPGFSRSNKSEKAFLSKLADEHNILLNNALDVLKTDYRKVKTYLIDTDKFFESLTSLNVKDPCLTIDHNGAHVCDNPEGYLFWDNLHMTTTAHELLSSEVYKLLPH